MKQLRSTACAAAIVLLVSSVAPVGAVDSASLMGRVTTADSHTPTAGAVVHLVDDSGDSVFRSDPTDDRGTFSIADARPGEYDLVVETKGGAFAAQRDVKLDRGSNRPLSLALRSGPNYERDYGFGESKIGTTGKWIIVGVVAASAILVIDELSDDENETEASGF